VKHGVHLELSDGVAGFERAEDGSLRVLTESGKAHPADIVILAIGVRPETALAWMAGLEIGKRGGETQIQGENNAYPLRMIDRADGMALLHVSAWRYYSRGFGSRLASLCYLCGRDDNGRWAVRVPGTCDTVMDALARIEPKEVQSARDNGITVLRQGDVYAVETKRAYDGKGAATLPSNHTWNPETRELRHLDSRSPHATLSIPFPVRFVAQSALRMGRTARRGSAD